MFGNLLYRARHVDCRTRISPNPTHAGPYLLATKVEMLLRLAPQTYPSIWNRWVWTRHYPGVRWIERWSFHLSHLDPVPIPSGLSHPSDSQAAGWQREEVWMCSGTSAIKEGLAFGFKQSTVTATIQAKHPHEAGIGGRQVLLLEPEQLMNNDSRGATSGCH